MEVVVMTEAIRHTKLQSKCQNQHPTLYRPDALPVTQVDVVIFQFVTEWCWFQL